jgi:hypothetical protein
MLGGVRESKGEEGAFVGMLVTGAQATGQFHCSSCAYGVTIHGELPRCPMCGGQNWEEAAWSPLSRALEQSLGGPSTV